MDNTAGKEWRKKLFDILEGIDELIPQEREQPKQEKMPRKDVQILKNPKYSGRGRQYTSDFKELCVYLHKVEKVTFEDLTAQYGVSKATITKWCKDKEYRDSLDTAKMRKHVEQVEKENKKLRSLTVISIFFSPASASSGIRTFNFMFAKQEKGSEAV